MLVLVTEPIAGRKFKIAFIRCYCGQDWITELVSGENNEICKSVKPML